MGGAKQKQIEDYEKGFVSGSDLKVCSKHFKDKDLEIFIDNAAHIGKCSFCDEPEFDDEEEETKVVHWDELMKKIMTSVNYFYTDPANELYHDSHEGGYQYLSDSDANIDSRDLINELLGYDTDYEVLEEIINSMVDQDWVEKDYYGPRESELLGSLWEKFSYLVRYKVRYVFSNIEEKSSFDDYSKKPSSILNDLGEFIMKLKLIKQFPSSSTLFDTELPIFRARQHKLKNEVNSVKDIGTAPNKFASANRFSPEAIPLFYGAEDSKTAIREIIDETKPDEYISIGEFYHFRKLNLIDLRQIKIIGFFNTDELEYREPSIFLKEFVTSISKKILPEENDRIEYIPSQITTEYFRHILPALSGKKIDGIIYKSIQNPGKDCYAIFADSSMCKDDGYKKPESDDEEYEEDVLLILKKDSIKTEKVSKF